VATYDQANRIRGIGATPVSHDADGNLISDGVAGYTWDARGRLATESGPGTTAGFSYEADGRRRSKTINGVTTGFLYDGKNPVQEKVNGAVTATITSSGVDGYQLRDAGGVTRRYLTDGLGSTLGLVDSAGAGASYTYEPFGRTYVAGNDGGNAYRYAGREDDGTGLYYNRARYYSPGLQRFLSEDPIGFDGGNNLYGYVGNQPTTHTDPDGEKPKSSYVDGPLPDYGQTSLYARYNPTTGEIYKWGISKNPINRYPARDYEDGSRMQIIKNYDDRMDALSNERYLTERWPGPDNYERWAGSVPTTRNWQSGIQDVKRDRTYY
jgi:RHS repeat-associated protein